MMEITAEIRALIDKAAAGVELAGDEYIDPADGLIHCKKCGGQRQTVVPCFGKPGYFMPRCICQCQREAEEQRRAAKERQRRMERIKRRKAQGLQDRYLYDYTFANNNGQNLGYSQRVITSSVHSSRSTVKEVIDLANALKIEWPLDSNVTNSDLKLLLYPARAEKNSNRMPIDFPWIHRELAKKGVTMTLLWTEYCEQAYAAGKQRRMTMLALIYHWSGGRSGEC